MASNPKVTKAYHAMQAIGIHKSKTKPVLKKLWLMHNKNWSFIEEDNYRVLADAIFEEEDAKELNEAGSLPHVELEPPAKRLRSQDVSSSQTKKSTDEEEEPVDNMDEETSLSPLPIAMIRPDQSEKKHSTSKSEDFEIFSSPSGEVKLSLSCKLPMGRQPNRDAILKLMEDDCVRHFKIIDPNFSLKNVFGHLCEGYLKLANPKTQDGSYK